MGSEVSKPIHDYYIPHYKYQTYATHFYPEESESN